MSPPVDYKITMEDRVKETMQRGTLDGFLSPGNSLACGELLAHPRTAACSSDPEGPVRWKGRGYRGITRPLRALFYPDYEEPLKRRHGRSSLAVGTRVHRHLYHKLTCLKGCRCKKKRHESDCVRRCKCAARPRGLHPYAKQALAKLRELEMVPMGCEVPLVSPSANVATRLDMICVRWSGPRARSVIVSVKTGYPAGSYDVDANDRTLARPFGSVPSTPKNHNQLQGTCELAILGRDYDIHFDDYVVLYLGHDERGAAKAEQLEPWAKSEKAQDAVLGALKQK